MRKLFFIVFIIVINLTSLVLYYRYRESKNVLYDIKKFYSNKERVSSLDYVPAETLKKGTIEMKKHKIIFMGTAQNVAEFLMNTIRTIENIGKYFADYRVIVFENDSKDATPEALAEWAKYNNKVKIITKHFDRKRRSNNSEDGGIAFLAKLRNFYIEESEKSEYDEFDIAMILDIDMNSELDERGVMESFAKINKWDGIFANAIIIDKPGKREYLGDPFAFWVPNMMDMAKFKTAKKAHAVKNDVSREVFKKLPVIDGLIKVDSAFNWLGIYKRKFINGCRYGTKKEGPLNICEHMYFNDCARKNGARLFINKNLEFSAFQYQYFGLISSIDDMSRWLSLHIFN